jgi:16S rRNA processing protein RimM
MSERDHAQRKVCIAKIGAPHGVRGEVRLWPYAQDPLALADYGPLESADGRQRFDIAALRPAKDHLVARFKGIDTRDAAEKLNGLELYVPRARLPATEAGEYYHADLIGLTALSPQGETLGRIVAVHNYGAGDILEFTPADGRASMLLPFSDAVAPSVDVHGGTIVLDLPQDGPGDLPGHAADGKPDEDRA